MKDEEKPASRGRTSSSLESPTANPQSLGIGRGGFDSRTALAWTAVSVPIAWGVWVTLSQAFVLFSNRV